MREETRGSNIGVPPVSTGELKKGTPMPKKRPPFERDSAVPCLVHVFPLWQPSPPTESELWFSGPGLLRVWLSQ